VLNSLPPALEAAQGSSGQIGLQQSLLKSGCLFLLLCFLPSPATPPAWAKQGDKAWLSPSDCLHPIKPFHHRYRRKETASRFSPLCTAQLPCCTCGPPALLHTHTCSHPPTNTHTLALHSSSLTETFGAKVSSTPRGREMPPSLPLPGCFSSTAAAFPFPIPLPLLSKSIASREGKRRTSYLRSPPRGPAPSYPYPQLLLVSSAGREGWQGPADSSQMLAKCSYVITVFSILPPRLSCMPPPCSSLALSPSLLPPTPHSITICSAQHVIPSGSKLRAFGYCRCCPWKESSHVFQGLGSEGQHCSVLTSSPSLPSCCQEPLPCPSVVPAGGEGDP